MERGRFKGRAGRNKEGIGLLMRLLAALLCASAAFAQGVVKDTLLVQLREASSRSDSHKEFAAQGASEVGEVEQLRVHVLRVPEQAIEKVRAALARSGRFEFVEREGQAQESALPADPLLPEQWHHYVINSPAAWLTTMGSMFSPIAFLDSGIDLTHPDLQARIVPGYNFVAWNTDTSDIRGHGTLVAGAAAGAADNGIGGAGVAGVSPIMPIIVLDASGWASYSNIARGIIYAADHGVRIVSISITGTSSSATLQSAVNYAWNRGTVVFAAAGNTGTTTLGYPAACDKVIAVGATDSADNRASYSSYGAWIDVTAPGSGILTTVRGGWYGYASGTSLAAPIAAGVGALMLSVRPWMSASDLTRLLKAYTRDLGAPGFDVEYGAGRVDANLAVLAAARGW